MVILSLFDYSGNWPSFYKQAGYDVYQVDVKHDIDILELSPDDLPDKVHGILAAPPCTDFASSGAQYWKAKDLDGRTEASLALIDKTLEIIRWCDPNWWALENPVGRLQKLRPQLGDPWYFQPHWFGDAYTKKTGLWGTFNRDLPRNPVEPDPKSWLMQLGGKSERTKELRSMTPLGFAKSFFMANP
ncbi:MAG: DNA cytosine methyltransferase [bacterium]